MSHLTLIVFWTVVSLGLLGAKAQAGPAPKAVNRVAILIDGSGSYKDRQAQAVAKAVTLLEQMGEKRVRRWETGDEIAIIALDAMPDVLFRGSLQELKAVKPDAWVARFKARSDYIKHTDLVTAFELALRHLEGDPRYVSKYLIAFTDLIHDPIGGPAPKKGKPTPPPAAFPFAGLEGVAVSVLWCPYPQKQAWLAAVREQGLAESFQIYTTSESGTVTLKAPPKPKVKLTEGEREAQRAQVVAGFQTVLRSMALVLLAILILPPLAWLWGRWRGRRSPRRKAPPTINPPR